MTRMGPSPARIGAGGRPDQHEDAEQGAAHRRRRRGAGARGRRHGLRSALPGRALPGTPWAVSGGRDDPRRGHRRRAQRADDVTVTLDTGAAHPHRAPRPPSASRSTSTPPSTRCSPRTSRGRRTRGRWSPRADLDAVVAHRHRRRRRARGRTWSGQVGKAGACQPAWKLASDKQSFVVVPGRDRQDRLPRQLPGRRGGRGGRPVVHHGHAGGTSTPSRPSLRQRAACPAGPTRWSARATGSPTATTTTRHPASSRRRPVSIPTTEGHPGHAHPPGRTKRVQAWVDKVAKDAKGDPARRRAQRSALLGQGARRGDRGPRRQGTVVERQPTVARAAAQAVTAGKNYSGRFTYDTTPAKSTAGSPRVPSASPTRPPPARSGSTST